MVTLQDISHQLIQPAKELADWSFPLSEILEMYLEELNNINFGEAALILQNSTNVYVQRVHCLHSEMVTLQESFNEKTDNGKNSSREKRRPPKLCNVEDFDLIDMEKDVGKNINLNPNKNRKPVKLISQRFTQLESIGSAKSNLVIYDVHDEIVGKKYDFRCNQPVNITFTLLDEQSPDDYRPLSGCPVIEERNTPLTSEGGLVLGTRTSGYQSGPSPFESTTINDLDIPLLSPGHDDDIVSNFDDHKDSPIITDASKNIENTTDPENPDVTLKSQDVNTCLNTNDGGTLESAIVNNAREKMPGMIDENTVTIKDKKADDRIPEKLETLNSLKENYQVDVKSSCKRDAIAELALIQNRRTKRDKNSIMLLNDINETTSQFAPLSTSYRRKLLSQHMISLLSSKDKRKRKIPAKSRKRELELSPERVLSSTWSTNFKLQEQDLKKFQSDLNNCFRLQSNFVPYEAVMNRDMDFLGFRYSNNVNRKDLDSDLDSRCPSPVSIEDNDWIHPPSPCNDSPDYQSLIADRVKDVFKECVVTTELDQTVAEWHKSLQPKLMESDQRPAFRIEEYTSRIMQRVQSSEQQKCNFENVIHDQPVHEIARYFLASLHLANTYKVEISTGNSNDMEIALCTKRRK